MYSACSEGAAHARALTSGTSIGGIRSSAASTRVLTSHGALRSSVGSVECASAGCPADEKERAPSPEASGMCTLSWHVPFPCPGQLRPEEPAQSVLAKYPGKIGSRRPPGSNGHWLPVSGSAGTTAAAAGRCQYSDRKLHVRTTMKPIKTRRTPATTWLNASRTSSQNSKPNNGGMSCTIACHAAM